MKYLTVYIMTILLLCACSPSKGVSSNNINKGTVMEKQVKVDSLDPRVMFHLLNTDRQ